MAAKISTRIKNDGTIIIRSNRIGGDLFTVKPYHQGGYFIAWWYGIGNCFVYINKFTDLFSLARYEENRIMTRNWRI